MVIFMITEQRKRFIEEYLKLHCKNATQAAKNAGYSQKTAHSQASGILKDSEVLKYLNERKSQLESELRQEFVFEASEAFEILRSIMKNKNASDRDRIVAARDVLDRAGFNAKEKIELDTKLDEEKNKLDDLLHQIKEK